MNKRLIIYGAGGHGRVVADASLRAGYTVSGFIDSNKALGTAIYNDIQVVANAIDEATLGQMADCFIVAVGNNEVRERIYTLLAGHLTPAVVIHPAAIIDTTASIGEGSVVLANAVVSAGTSIGTNCIVNAMVLVDHDSHVSDNVHLAQGTIIGSNVTIGKGHTTQLGDKINSFTVV